MSYKLPKGQSGFNHIKRIYIRNAGLRKLEFDLTDKQLHKLFSSRCAYCGDTPSKIAKFTYRNYSPEGILNSQYLYNGIDRINNSKGYIMKNCVTCCEKCNRMKFAYAEKEFLKHIEKIYNYRKENKL